MLFIRRSAVVVGLLAGLGVAGGAWGSSLVGQPIRVLSLGDSIMEGSGSYATSGYRMTLNDLLAGSGIDYGFVGGRYSHASGSSGRGTFVNGQAINDNSGTQDPLFESWMRHYGIGGASADSPDAYSNSSDFRTETYSNLRSLVDRFVDRDDPFNVNSIRDPLNPSVTASADGDFQSTVFGTNSGGDPETPNVILLHIGTNTVNGTSAANTAQRLNTLLRVFDLLRTTPKADGSGQTYLPSDVHVAVAQIIPRFVDDGTFDETWLDRSYDYNFLDGLGIGDAQKDSTVYDGLSSQFKDQIIPVNHFAVTAATVLTDAVRAAAALLNPDLDTDQEILDAIDPDNDGLVDWALTTGGLDPYNELTNDPSSIGDSNLAYNTSLLDDGIHPTVLGHAIMAEDWYQQFFQPFAVPVPEPSTLAGVTLLFGWCGRRSRSRSRFSV